jgi:hypothetical protein
MKTLSLIRLSQFCLFSVALWNIACDERTPEVEFANAPISGTNAVLVLRRSSAHPFLAEYQRQLQLKVGGALVAETPLPKDTGGIRRLNVYHPAPDRILLRDAAYDYDVNIHDASITVLDHHDRSLPMRGFVGAFDEDQNKNIVFVPKQARAELPIET